MITTYSQISHDCISSSIHHNLGFEELAERTTGEQHINTNVILDAYIACKDDGMMLMDE